MLINYFDDGKQTLSMEVKNLDRFKTCFKVLSSVCLKKRRNGSMKVNLYETMEFTNKLEIENLECQADDYLDNHQPVCVLFLL